jgi:hypothetical protein
VAAPPCYELGDLVACNLGDELVLAEELDDAFKLLPRIGGGGVMLADFEPVPPGDVVEAQRSRGCSSATSALAFSRSARSTASACRLAVALV